MPDPVSFAVSFDLVMSFGPGALEVSGAAKGGGVSSKIQQMMHSQKIARDLLDKGAHFNVGKIELKAIPDHLGGVTFKPVHPGIMAKNKAAYDSAVKSAKKALQTQEFRSWLTKQAQKGFVLSSQSGNAKALEFKSLMKALERMQ